MHLAAIHPPTNKWTIHDLQAVILLVPGPFTTCRAVQRRVPRSHQLFTHHNSQRAMEELQASGLGMVHDTGRNQTAYHKPLPTEENKNGVEKFVQPKYSWADYQTSFAATNATPFTRKQYNTLLSTSPYAPSLAERFNICPL